MMSSELTYPQVLDLLPAYAIGALEPEEMLAVDAYLKNQQDLLSRLRQLESATAQLAGAAPDAPLPANAKSRLMARVQADLASERGEAVAAMPISQPVMSGRSSPSPQKQSRHWLTNLFPNLKSKSSWVVATAALLGLIFFVIYVFQLQSRLGQLSVQLDVLQKEISHLQLTNNQLQQTNAALQQQLQTNQRQLDQASGDLDSLKAQLANLQATNTQLQQQQHVDQEMLALIANTAPERVLQLPGTAESPQASGTFYGSSDYQGVLVLQGLAPLPSDQTYQLWLIPPAGPPESVGLLAVQAPGPTWLTVEIPPAARNFAKVGLSLEPAGGSPAPTTVVLLGPVS